VDDLHSQRGQGLSSSDPNSIFKHCETREEQSVLDQLKEAEIGLRGGGTFLRAEGRTLQDKNLFGSNRIKKAGIFDFIWLVYSVFFFIQPIEEHSRTKWIAFAGVYLCFLGIYAGLVYARSRRTQYLLLTAMAALGAAYYPFNAGAAGMFIYVAAFVPFVSESIAVCVATFIGVSAITMVEGWRLHISPWSWGFNIFFSIAVGSGNLVAAQRMRANKRLDLAHEQIAHLAKLAERERIARDLHDVLGHTLSVVVLKSELAGKLMDRDPARARHEIGEVEHIARKALTEVRQAISGYRSEGLAAEILRAQKTLDAAGVTLEFDTKPPQLAPAEETVLSLIVREAVTNIVRHAQASHCRLEFAEKAGGTALVVEDDGRGGIREEGNGLRGMRERVESMGGRLLIESAQGTRLLIEIPPQIVGES
jgi:two-component system sensor histidine kinase DesK